MQTLIPKMMQKQVARARTRLGISERTYVSNALAHYRQLLALDSKLKEEISLWDRASSFDFATFTKRHRV
jgi:hypothetical protein